MSSSALQRSSNACASGDAEGFIPVLVSINIKTGVWVGRDAEAADAEAADAEAADAEEAEAEEADA